MHMHGACPRAFSVAIAPPARTQIDLPSRPVKGARFAFGTDSGAIPNVGHHQLVEGLVTFGGCAGMRPAELLRTATSEAAVACRVEGETGSLMEGLSADLLVLPSHPLESFFLTFTVWQLWRSRIDPS